MKIDELLYLIIHLIFLKDSSLFFRSPLLPSFSHIYYKIQVFEDACLKFLPHLNRALSFCFSFGDINFSKIKARNHPVHK